jgi:hypothetical protein
MHDIGAKLAEKPEILRPHIFKLNVKGKTRMTRATLFIRIAVSIATAIAGS